MMRRFAAFGLVLAMIVAFVLGSSAQSDPGTGVSVPTLAEHNALEARVTDLEQRVDELETAPEPTPDPTEEPTPTPTPTPTEPPTTDPPGTFPTQNSVGPEVEPTVAYGGSCTVTQDNLVIEARIINCPGGLTVNAVGLVIRNSIVNGKVTTNNAVVNHDTTAGNNVNHPTIFTIESSRVLCPIGQSGCRPVGMAHFVVRDSLLRGQHSGGWAHNKVVLVGNYITTDGTSTHQSGMRILKNSTLRGNTLFCTPAGSDVDGGCSADAVFYREFGIPQNLTIEGNYFRSTKPESGQGQWYATRFAGCNTRDDCVNIRFTGNTFDRGQGTDGGEFPNDAGDVWADNVWIDGQPARSDTSR